MAICSSTNWGKLREDGWFNKKYKNKKVKDKPKSKPKKTKSGSNKKTPSINNDKREISPMEMKIKCLLSEWKITYVREYQHKKLKNPKTGCGLYVDFYLPEYKMAIEYDGKQHYEDENKERLKSQKYRDGIKNKWCKDNNIQLLRIPYWRQSLYKELVEEFLKPILDMPSFWLNN